MRSFRISVALSLAILGLPTAGLAQGYQVQPMVATIEPSGANARLTMSIKNTGAVPITLEMTPFRATADEAGTPTRVDEEKDILLFPPQAVLGPGKEQAVQVRYIGDPSLAEARMYGVRVSQLPVTAQGMAGSSGAASDVKVSFNFLSHIVVSPAAARPAVQVEDAGRAPNGDLLLRITNTGPGIAILGTSQLKLADGAGKTVTLDPDRLKAGDFGALMPRQARRGLVASKDVAGLVGPIKPTLTLQ